MDIRLAVLVYMVACGTEPAPESRLPMTATPPPLVVQPFGPCAGEQLSVDVLGANPGDQVLFFASVQGPGQTCSRPGTYCIDLDNARFVGAARANNSGAATQTVALPPQLTGSLWVQAAVRTPTSLGRSSVVSASVVPGGLDSDGDLLSDCREQQLGTDAATPDSDGDGISDYDDAWPWLADPLGPHEVEVHRVAPNSTVMTDPEFNSDGTRFAWQDSAGREIWTGGIDLQTGAFMPLDGKGQLVDVDVARMARTKNGPEWAFAQASDELVYTRDDGGQRSVWRATWDGTSWQTSLLQTGAEAWSPTASITPGDATPRVRYKQAGPTGDEVAYQRLGVPSSIAVAPLYFMQSRFVIDTPWLAGAARGPGTNLKQLYLIDTDTDTMTSLTQEAVEVADPFFWQAPEYGGETMFLSTWSAVPGRPDRIVAYRDLGSGWEVWHTIPMPAGWPTLESPEPFTWNGQSYVTFYALGLGGTTSIFVASLDPSAPRLWRVSPAESRSHRDPEAHTQGVRPWVYYTRTGGDVQIWRAELGL